LVVVAEVGQVEVMVVEMQEGFLAVMQLGMELVEEEEAQTQTILLHKDLAEVMVRQDV
jgi:hypothetical protein